MLVPSRGSILFDKGGPLKKREQLRKHLHYWDGVHATSKALDKRTRKFIFSLDERNARPWIVLEARETQSIAGSEVLVLAAPVASTPGKRIRDVRTIDLPKDLIGGFPYKEQQWRFMMAACVETAHFNPYLWLGLPQNLTNLIDFWADAWSEVEKLWDKDSIDAAFARRSPSRPSLQPIRVS